MISLSPIIALAVWNILPQPTPNCHKKDYIAPSKPAAPSAGYVIANGGLEGLSHGSLLCYCRIKPGKPTWSTNPIDLASLADKYQSTLVRVFIGFRK